jgi:DNA-binding NtrC family response regulator
VTPQEPQQTVFVIEDERAVRRALERLLEREGYKVTGAESAEVALAALKDVAPDAVCLDIELPGMSGLDALGRILQIHPEVPVLMLTSESAVEAVVRAMRQGAYDYIAKPYDSTRLLTTLRNAMEVRHVPQRVAAGPAPRTMLGRSAAIEAVYRQIDRVAATDVTVLIRGETGTGKELAAHAIHDAGARAHGPFVALSCAAIPESLQEAEFFGHERGAFTDAVSTRRGRFEQAHKGTLFLDEVGELGPTLQAKLLRALQERAFHRIGGTQEIHSDFRLITATNRDLGREVERGRFRADLYFRLAVFELEVPPLRARDDDVLLLARALIERSGRAVTLDASAERALRLYSWPGNVRELENTIQRALVLCKDNRVTAADLPARVLESGSAVQPASGASPGSRTMHDAERLALEQALAETEGNVSEAVRRLGIGRTTAYRLMRKHRIRP